jgi:hypothetical protein
MSSFAIDDLDAHRGIEEMAMAADHCLENGDLNGYLDCIEGDLMPAWFARDSHRVSDGDYWSSLRYVYNTVQPAPRWLHVFDSLLRSERSERHEFMTPEERDVFARLPDTFTVYRGFFLSKGDNTSDSFSWTIDQERAARDAVMLFGREDICVIIGLVRKADLWAYGWGGEVMISPNKVIYTSARLIDAGSVECGRTEDFEFDIEGWLKEANRGS